MDKLVKKSVISGLAGLVVSALSGVMPENRYIDQIAGLEPAFAQIRESDYKYFNSEELYKKGLKQEGIGNFEESIKLYNAAIKTAKKDKISNNGLILMSMGNTYLLWAEVLLSNTTTTDDNKGRENLIIAIDKYADSAKIIKKTLSSNKEGWLFRVYYNKGRAHQKLSKQYEILATLSSTGTGAKQKVYEKNAGIERENAIIEFETALKYKKEQWLDDMLSRYKLQKN